MANTRRTSTSEATESPERLSAEERAALKERTAELKAAGRRKKSGKADGESDLLAKIAEMPESDRVLAERVHALVTAAAPELTPKTWYGMPAYALDGQVLCFFQAAAKFKSRYATFGFNDNAKLDDGNMWPTSYALTALGDAEEAAITALLKKAVA
jgi:uncharacterized protein YdhG (YjbR/CyaY superfamily)